MGCGIYLETQGGEIAGVYPSMSHPANRGRICVRGWHVYEIARRFGPFAGAACPQKRSELVEVGFEEAYDVIARRCRKSRTSTAPVRSVSQLRTLRQ